MHRESVFLLFSFFFLPPPCNNIHRIHRIKEVYEEEEYFSEKFKKHLTASKLSPWKSNIVFRELFHYSRSTRIFKMGNKKKEEERRERERERGTNEERTRMEKFDDLQSANMKTTAKRPLVDANPLYKVLVLHLQKTCFLERRGTFSFAYIRFA